MEKEIRITKEASSLVQIGTRFLYRSAKERMILTKGQFTSVYGALKWDRFVWDQVFRTLIILLIFLTLASPTPCVGETKRLLRIGTGGLTGVYYPIGKLIAQGLTGSDKGKNASETNEHGVPGYIGVAQNSAGSIENVQMVTSGEIEAGIVQADVAAWSVRSEHAFAGDKTVRVVRAVASLYPEKFQIVTRRDANIRNVMDLRGKRVSIDEVGSATVVRA